MEISIKRDGLTLRGDLLRPEREKCPVVILFHGFMSSRGSTDSHMFCKLAKSLVEAGLGVVKFDFNGHGESDGEFSDMNIYSEILDASKIIDYVRSLPFVTEIYIAGHSQGALVGGMAAGFYREVVKKLVMLSPAATIKEDALAGSCFGTPYDKERVPDYFPVVNEEQKHFNVGGLYFRIARTIPVYETTSMFEGKTLIIHGTADDVVGVWGAEKYTEYMPNAELVLVEGENHGLCAFAQDQIIDRVTAFLSKEDAE